MTIYLRSSILKGKRLLAALFCLTVLLGLASVLAASTAQNKAGEDKFASLSLIQGNSLLPVADPNGPEKKVVREMNVIATAYSSTVWQTDDTPFITAAGTQVRDGVIANNILPFGTKIRIPELYGDKVFVVEDRMNWKKGNYQIDIWFSSYNEAKAFGAQTTYIEVLEN